MPASPRLGGREAATPDADAVLPRGSLLRNLARRTARAGDRPAEADHHGTDVVRTGMALRQQTAIPVPPSQRTGAPASPLRRRASTAA
jgi:hypothetical protein